MNDNKYIEIEPYARAYRLHHGDIFCVDVETFLKTSTFWSNEYQIMGTDKTRKRWWQFWKRRLTFVKIKYVGGILE